MLNENEFIKNLFNKLNENNKKNKNKIEKENYYIFLIGPHNSGKTYLRQQFTLNINNFIQPAESTYGFEYCNFKYNENTYIHLIEINDPSEKNLIFLNFLNKYYENCCLLFLYNLEQLNQLENINENFLKYFFNITINHLNISNIEEKKLELKNFYEKDLSNNIIILEESLKKFSFLPLILIGTNFNEKKMNFSFTKKIREFGLPYCSGIALSNTKSLLEFILSLIKKKNLLNNFQYFDLKNFIIPPGFDSEKLLNGIENLTISKNNSPEISESVQFSNYEEFLKTLFSQIEKDL